MSGFWVIGILAVGIMGVGILAVGIMGATDSYAIRSPQRARDFPRLMDNILSGLQGTELFVLYTWTTSSYTLDHSQNTKPNSINLRNNCAPPI